MPDVDMPPEAKAESKAGQERGQSESFWEWIMPLLVVVVCVCLVRMFLLDVNVVYGSSMAETLHNGDVIISQKFALGDIKRGDIVTIRNELEDELIVKRVIGLPREHITIDSDGYVYADGELLPDEYQIPAAGLVLDYFDLQLGYSQYFVMGDNRDNSYDSRYFGAVNEEDIRDIAVLRCYPFTVY